MKQTLTAHNLPIMTRVARCGNKMLRKMIRSYSFLIFISLTLQSQAQEEYKTSKGFGIYLGYSVNKTGSFGIGYIRNGNAFYIGLGSQQNGQKGKEVTERKSNYGSTITGANSFYETGDFGYERMLSKSFALGGIATVGTRKYYTNYRDDKFNGGGFHIINKKKTIAGGGGYATWYFSDYIGLSAGYTTLKNVFFDLRVRIAD